MDAAVTALTPANQAAMLAEATPDTPRGPLARLQALPARKKTLLAFGTAGLLAVLIALALWSRHVPMSPLFPQVLPNNELGLVVEQLTKLGEHHELASGGGGLIMVPTDRVNALRMKLAMAGLPKSAPSGFEVMDKASFGQSQLQERTHLQRALASQLEQQIATISAVQSVKVMVALVAQTGFYREQDKPSASVALTLQPGRTLDRSQIAGIVNMTATAVPGLSPKAVSITDQDGNWLTQPDSELRSDLTQQQRAHLRETEARLLQRVNEILEPALGKDNLRATVTAELDFNQVEQTSEAFAPNQGPDARAAVRSQQSIEATGTLPPQPVGVPGAATNQAPTPAAAPATAASAAPLQAAQAGLAGNNARRESTINYEVGKTVEVKRAATGEVRRVNVAVLVNHRTTLDAKTGKPNSAPLPPEELEKLTALVQEAVGFNKDRGDSVRVVNIPFRADPKADPEAVPVWKQPWLVDLVKAGALPAALTLVALMLLFGVVRPALRPDPPPPPPPEPEAALNAVVDDTEALPGPNESEMLALENNQKVEAQLTDARELAKQNPVAVANILRAWMTGDE
jgi:flagellar M-ring protein FliF